jgi:rRNA-processing protein FCF1
MVDYLSICVVDTSLLIDLYIGNLLVEFFKLPYSFVAPDVIIAELQTPDSKMLLELGLRQSELVGRQVLEVVKLRALYNQPSVNDLFALVTARISNATLLTSDGNLRKVAHQERIPTHGTLWILDEMVRLEVISCIQAAKALKLMCEKGSRLPLDECNKRFREWED